MKRSHCAQFLCVVFFISGNATFICVKGCFIFQNILTASSFLLSGAIPWINAMLYVCSAYNSLRLHGLHKFGLHQLGTGIVSPQCVNARRFFSTRAHWFLLPSCCRGNLMNAIQGVLNLQQWLCSQGEKLLFVQAISHKWHRSWAASSTFATLPI